MHFYLLPFILLFEPKSIIELPVRSICFELYDEKLYLAQANGRAITKIDTSNIISQFPISTINNRIYGFKVTPFSIYLNMVGGIFKLYLNSGYLEKIYDGNVSSFVITKTEDIVLADRLKNELIFLDSQYDSRIVRKNLSVIDMDYFEQRIYLLTRNGIFVLDEHGNIMERIKIFERCDRIVVKEKIYLFKIGGDTILEKDGDWERLKLSHPLLDLKITERNFLALTQYGDSIYIYDKSDF